MPTCTTRPVSSSALRGRYVIPAVPEVAVGVVFEHDEVILLRKDEQVPAAVVRQRGTGQVLDAGNRVEEFRELSPHVGLRAPP